MNSIKLSVVITHLDEPFELHESLRNIVAALPPDSEIIIVDDGSGGYGSTTAEAVAKFHGARFWRLPENKGVPSAMNAGLDLAAGKWVYFAACGDFVQSRFFHAALAQLEVHEYLSPVMCCAKSLWKDTETGVEWVDSKRINLRGFVKPDEVANRIRSRALHITSHTTIFRTEALRNLGGFDLDFKWHCDFYATHRLALEHGICFVPEVGVHVNLRRGSYSDVDRYVEEHRRVVADIFEAAPDSFENVLDLLGWPAFECAIVWNRWKRLRSFRFLWRCLRREMDALGRRYLPAWAQRLAIKLT